ncbi:hypothetical protein [Tumebacillus lipolyticus]|uniref:Uncharacterized protein n=1 Tax=Tumebacillus lipolyticus TaxID=1280370 RepID=A0ABW4ZRD6_9BACL
MTYHGKGQILSIAKPISKERTIEQMESYSNHEYWHQHVDSAEEMIDQTGTYERISFLILPLASAHSVSWDAVLDRPDLFRERMGDQLKRFWGYLKRKATNGKGIPVLTEAELEVAKKAGTRMLNSLEALIPQVRPATPQELELLHRAPYHRGLHEIPTILPSPLPSTVLMTTEGVTLRPRPLKLSLTSAVVQEDTFRLRLKHEDGSVSYQSVMAAATMPEYAEQVGDEWLYQPLEHLDFPIDVSIHFEVTPPKKARDTVHRRQRRRGIPSTAAKGL